MRPRAPSLHRRVTLAAHAAFRFVLFLPPALLVLRMAWPARIALAVLVASVYPACWLAGTLYVLRRRPAYLPNLGAERSAKWRWYDGDRPARWRSGTLHRTGTEIALVPFLGETGPRLRPAVIGVLAERDATLREGFGTLDPIRVLELDAAGRRLDVVLAAADVPAVREWLGAGQGAVSRPAT